MSRDFNNFRFSGLNYKPVSNNYWSMNRINEEETKIVVRVAPCHLMKTKYGYALILDRSHVVFIKDWQVGFAAYGKDCEVVLDRDYFAVKEWGDFDEFDDLDEDDAQLTWNGWLDIAKQQQPVTPVSWAR